MGVDNSKLHEFFDAESAENIADAHSMEDCEDSLQNGKPGETVLPSPLLCQFRLISELRGPGKQFKSCVRKFVNIFHSAHIKRLFLTYLFTRLNKTRSGKFKKYLKGDTIV